MAEMFFEDKYVTDCDVVFLIVSYLLNEIVISCNWEAGFLVTLYTVHDTQYPLNEPD